MLHKRITSTLESTFENFYRLISMRAPRLSPFGRTSWNKLLADPHYHLKMVSDAHVPMGYFGFWQYGDIILVDLFILAPEFRGMGLGKSYWEWFTKRCTGPILASWNPRHEYALSILDCLHYDPITVSTSKGLTRYYVWEDGAQYTQADLRKVIQDVESKYRQTGWTSYIGFDWSDQSECRKLA